ncbi:Hypothetical protein A7982_00326 [Minicystis rosea]|nr:Hypothetical protein A7982_00326 [Minicystis rosea]
MFVISIVAPLVAGCASSGVEVVMLPQAANAAPVQQGPGAPRVHIEAAKGANIEGIELRELIGWELVPYGMESPDGMGRTTRNRPMGRVVCAPPCDVVVDARRGQDFYLAGEGITDSPHFKLSDAPVDLRLTVSPGRAGLWSSGLALTTLGGIGVSAGSVVLGVGAGSKADGARAAGGISLAAGGLMLASGILMLVQGRTTFQRRQGQPLAAPAQ